MLRILVKDSAVYAVGVLVSRMVGFVMIPIYTRVLTPEDYGILDAIARLVDIMGLLLALGVGHAILRYFNQPKKKQRDRLTSTAIVLMMGMTLLGLALLMPAGGWITTLVFGDATHSRLVRVAIGGMLLANFATLPMTIFRAAGRPWRFTAYSIAQLITGLSFNILLVVVLRMGVLGALLSTVLTNAIWGVILTGNLVREVGISWDAGFARQLLAYGIPLVPASIAAFILNFSDRFFLVRFVSMDEIGLYSLAYRFAMLVTVVFGVVVNAWWPWVFKVASEGDHRRLLRDGGALVLMFLAVSATGVILFSGPVIQLVAAREFHGATAYVPPLAVAYWLFATGATFSVGARLAERTDAIAWANGAAAMLCLLLSVWLIPEYGAWGAVWMTVTAFAARGSAILYASNRVMALDQEWGTIAVSVLVLVAASAFAMLDNLSTGISLFARTLLWVTLSLALAAYCFRATERLESSLEWIRSVAREPGRLLPKDRG